MDLFVFKTTKTKQDKLQINDAYECSRSCDCGFMQRNYNVALQQHLRDVLSYVMIKFMSRKLFKLKGC